LFEATDLQDLGPRLLQPLVRAERENLDFFPILEKKCSAVAGVTAVHENGSAPQVEFGVLLEAAALRDPLIL